jgi:hypothetical protein
MIVFRVSRLRNNNRKQRRVDSEWVSFCSIIPDIPGSMNKNNQKDQRKQRKKTNKTRVTRPRFEISNDAQQLKSIPRMLISSGSFHNIRDVADDTIRVKLKYYDTTMVRNNAGLTYLSWRYRMNSVYDPDPSLATGAISGFAEWAAIYSTYRVLSIIYQIKLANNEAFPLQVSTAPTFTDIGINALSSVDLAELKYAKYTMMAAKGGRDMVNLQGALRLDEIFGASYLYDPTFNAAVTTNPSTILYLNVGVNSPSPLVNGVTPAVRIIYDVLFYRRQNIFA